MQLRAGQRAVVMRSQRVRRFLMLWRRQFGKTTTLGNIALLKMMRTAGKLVTFASASLLVGREVILKEAKIFSSAIEEYAELARKSELALDVLDRGNGKSIADSQSQIAKKGTEGTGKGIGETERRGNGISLDDFAEVYEAGRLEFRIWHDRTRYSRTQIIAPSVATARGYTGDVIIDEIGYIKGFRELFAEMSPIASSDPTFNILMATTPPIDDSHYSFELAVPPVGMKFAVKPEGNWYTSQAGLLVHRLDAWDGCAAGVPLYDEDSGDKLTPEEHRARALDKEGWDRNYALVFKFGGTAACSLSALAYAQETGAKECCAVELDSDADLPRALGMLGALLSRGGAEARSAIGVGFDVATTEKEKSNPSALAVVEKVGMDYVVRLILRWKTADPERAEELIRGVLEEIKGQKSEGRGRGIKCLCVDATNERYFAVGLKKRLSGTVFSKLVIASETIEKGTEEMTFKSYLGNLLVNALEDRHLLLPLDRWVRNDFRLVFRNKGSFENEVDSAGNHGDTFDAVKLGIYAVESAGGPGWAKAARVGGEIGAMG